MNAKFPLAVVYWNDAHSMSGWAGDEDNLARSHGAWPVVSIGHLIKHDSTGVTLCRDQAGETLGSPLFIPKGMLANVQKVPYKYGVK